MIVSVWMVVSGGNPSDSVSDHCRWDKIRPDQIRGCLGINIQYDSKTNPCTGASGPVTYWQAEERRGLIQIECELHTDKNTDSILQYVDWVYITR